MAEFTGLVTFKGNPLTLVGDEVNVGDQAPDFTVHKNLMETISLSDLKGKTVVLSVAPSVDTGVCAMQLKAFNKQAAALDGVEIVNITRDLPFALGRFCGAEGVDKVTAASDALLWDFGEKYGVLMKELHLLARSVFVIDGAGKVAYKEIVPEMTTEPNYAAAIEAVKALS